MRCNVDEGVNSLLLLMIKGWTRIVSGSVGHAIHLCHKLYIV